MKVIFCHGLESGPIGRKSIALKDAGFDLLTPDFRGQMLAERIETLHSVLKEVDNPLIVGSSYGGITALITAMQAVAAGGSIHALVLCAPALWRGEPPADSMDSFVAPVTTTIIHGVHDEIVSIDASRSMKNDPNVTLLEVDDDHGLSASIPLIVETVRSLLPT
jgi:alpha/beta superfamily hydrolase